MPEAKDLCERFSVYARAEPDDEYEWSPEPLDPDLFDPDLYEIDEEEEEQDEHER